MLDGSNIDAVLKTYLGLIGSAIAAFVGLLSRHSVHPEGFSWKRLFTELPVAAFAAILAGGVGEFFQWPEIVRYAIAGSIAYLGPALVFTLLQKYMEKKK